MAGNFHAVRCPDCENEQSVFEKASTEVSCAVCGHTLARPTGGKAEYEGEVVDTVERRSTSESGDGVQAR
ncbi:30S ribosomal protein S27e [Halobacteriales archaeon QS_9_68_17]|nr:MAG: 30S ribosomal protein S27e [Halobacteriales archaeon QS_9_68_17]